MRQRHVGFSRCWLLILVFVTPAIGRGQTSQHQDHNSAAQNADDENKKIVALATEVINRHERQSPVYQDGSVNNSVSSIQALSACLDSLKVVDRALVLRAINCLTIDATAEVYSSATMKHEMGQLSEEDWFNTLWVTSDLLPDRMNQLLLSSLEAWQTKYPNVIMKSPPRKTFEPWLVRRISTNFQLLAAKSKSTSIASAAFDALVQKDKEYQSLLHTSANRFLTSTIPKHRVYGIQLFSQLKPGWTGHQVRLKQLTDDPDERVARAATGVWLHNPLPNDKRRLLEAVSADSDIEKVVALNRFDTDASADWGSLEPVTKLVSSGSVDVRKAAIRAISRTHPHITKPLTETIKNDPNQDVRQLALDQVQLRGWYPPGNNDIVWTLNTSGDSYFALLADAGRNGLKTEPAMQRLTEPFGYHLHSLYADLGSGQLRESEKLKAIAQLLDSDPSLQATETAIDSLREIIAISQARNKKGYLGQAIPVRDFIARHAKRLYPIVPELCAFIEQTQSKRLVATLSSFGMQAKPSIDLLIKILEDDTGTWRASRRTAIFTIRELQQHGKPALDTLLKVAHDDDYSASLIAALTYLDLGGDPAALMPKYALRLPVLVKIDPAELIAIPKFRSELKSAVTSDCPWKLLQWLGPDAEFLLPELKLKYKQLMPTPNSSSSETDKLIQLIPLFESGQTEFLPICMEYFETEPRSWRCRTALETLSMIGDDQHRAKNVVKSLMDTGPKSISRAAKSCYEKLYTEQKD